MWWNAFFVVVVVKKKKNRFKIKELWRKKLCLKKKKQKRSEEWSKSSETCLLCWVIFIYEKKLWICKAGTSGKGVSDTTYENFWILLLYFVKIEKKNDKTYKIQNFLYVLPETRKPIKNPMLEFHFKHIYTVNQKKNNDCPLLFRVFLHNCFVSCMSVTDNRWQ